MDSLIATAASGLRSRTESLDLLANNMANSSTAGYKADHESFDLYFGENAWGGYNEGRPAGSEMPLVKKNWTDMSQGTLLDTGNSGDIALSGSGFFVVNSPSGRLYTRNGHLGISPQGQLQTQEGYQVLNTNNQPIKLDPTQPFEVSRAGEITQGGGTIGTLQVLDVTQTDALTKRDASYFAVTDDKKLTAAKNVETVQGKAETSNVPVSEAAVKLVGVMRQFEMLQRAVHLAGDMNKQAVEQVARVSS